MTRPPKKILSFYNKRGASEHLFEQINNDFGWVKATVFIATAFMILTGIVVGFYRSLSRTYSTAIPWLRPTYRLKKSIFRFISVPAKWIR